MLRQRSSDMGEIPRFARNDIICHSERSEESLSVSLLQGSTYHNITLIEKLSAPEACLWYARKAYEEGWSRNILALQIERKLYERQGQAVHNFPAACYRNPCTNACA
ncbi:MAG: DUF1016 N-terminal domain-containing protein, partial [Fimbriimonadales bacterium]|nr:DUF1016 N-terminal domain-containing protein [Fimbriimonadales bacterium]